MKLNLRFFLVSCLVILLCTTGFVSAMPSDISGHWAEAEIIEMYESQIIQGYMDNQFRPNHPVTRAEFFTIINNYFGFTAMVNITFSDVAEGSWYRDSVAKAVAAGYVSGYDDNTIRPDRYITRQEAAVILEGMSNLKLPDSTADLQSFKDAASVKSWARSAVLKLIGLDLLKGYPDKTLKPDGNLTRAEALYLLYQIKHSRLPKITGLKLENGNFKVLLSDAAARIGLNDLVITAKLDGKPINLMMLNYETDNFFMFPQLRVGIPQTLEVTVSAPVNSGKITGSATATKVLLPPPPQVEVSTNTAPTKPVITRTPTSGMVTQLTDITITAESTDPDGDAIDYVWTGRIAETANYPVGKQIITVKAVDEHGAESDPSAIVFFVVDSATGSGGVMLTDPESRILEEGIEGATITHFTFNVPSVSGHWGSDYAWVRGYNIKTDEWDEIKYSTTPNGIYFEEDLPPGTYSKLEFFYYASHCMYGHSNITYTVEFIFGYDG